MSKKSFQRDLQHIRVYEWMAKCPAYRSLSVYARCLYFEIKRRYSGSNNGAISMAFREAKGLVGCSDTPLRKAFAELQEKGFIRAIQKGSFGWKTSIEGKNRATTWLLTEYKADHPVPSITAAKDFMRWSEIKDRNIKARCADNTPMVGSEHTANREMVGSEHTQRVSRAHHDTPKRPSDGVLRAHTYNTPHGVGGREDASDAA